MQAIMEGPEAHAKYVRDFFALQFPQGDVPLWVVEALATVDITVPTTLTATVAPAGDNEPQASTSRDGKDGEPAVKAARID